MNLNPRTLFLTFELLCVMLVCIPKLHAQSYVMQCDNGLCVMSQELVQKLLDIIEYWKGQAKSCNAI